ncbi:hypothetical protein VKT23_000130 [Stygiomarasmius scandens]|uniref:Uncharacterized protein n=1 Tax=Marasmiellus scandens TaxID=2682957 RepID=A0ABR1K992_9AGAR
MSDGPPAKHEESGSIGSSTLIIPNSNVKTQREKIEQIRCIIEDCSAFLDSLASDPPPQPILAKFFPESVHKEATEFIKLAEQNYCRLRDQVEYENLYWTTQEHVDTELMDRISDLLDNLGRTRPIFQTASNSIFPSVIRPPVSRPIKLFLTTQDALMRRKLEKKRDFEKHPAQIHLSVDTETRIDGELFHQLRPTASHMFPPESASPPGSEDIRAFLQTLAQNGFAESHSHLMSVFKNWETGSITSSTLITVLANVLESHPEVLETFQTVSARMVPSIKINIAVNTHGKISSVTLVLSNKDGLIIPISKELRGLVDEFSTATVITSSSGIRSLLASPNPEQSWNTLANMDERWMAAVIPLLQLELELATCASRIQQCSTLLRRVSRKNCCLPASFLLEDIEREGKNPISGGGFAVFTGFQWFDDMLRLTCTTDRTSGVVIYTIRLFV